jgi:translocation and assembly module TamA
MLSHPKQPKDSAPTNKLKLSMRYKILCLILTGWLLHQPASYALEMPALPFIGTKTKPNIELKNNPSLLKLLDDELTLQRKNNLQLQQYSKRNKITRYETQLLNERLRAEGYYAAQINTELANDHVTYQINSGALYQVKTITLQLPEHISIPDTVIGLKTGDPLRAEAVLASTKALTSYITSNFCLYRIDTDYRVVVEHQTKSANVTFVVADSPEVRFGDITFTGLQSIDSDYLRERLPIKAGECFKPSGIDSARLTLIQSNLLASVTAEISEPENDVVPITLRVVERHHRRVSAGIGFESDEGFGVSTGWEHRNLMGKAEKLSIDAHVAQNAQTLSSNLTLPHFQRNDQSISFYTDLSNDNTDAYQSETGTLGVEVTRQLKRNLRGIVGGELTFSEVEEDGDDDDYALLSLPFSLEYDRRSDPLDPRSGWVASTRIRPYWDAYDTGTKFLKSTFAASAYFTFDDFYWRPTIAMRTALGTISGIDREEVPANVRFYIGGGGSVRGYAYQTLGILTDDEPDGGLSFTEVSVEARLRWGQSWGGVVFLDGGFAYEEDLPQFGEDLLWGAGIGLRYYTSFAPIRLDIAVPLNKRDAVDDSYQLYISIGQAF